MSRSLTRRGLLVLAGGAGATLALPSLPARALTGGGDPDLVNLLITVELLQARLYGEGLVRVEDLDDDARETLTAIRRQESAHAAELTRLLPELGGLAVPERQVDFGDTFGAQDDFLDVARTLEETAVAAGNGVLAQLSSARAVEVVGAIVAAESAQLAAVRALGGDSAVGGAFDRPLSQSQVVGRLGRFLPESG